MGNFIDGIRTRKRCICDVEIGYRSVTVCHLGAIALRLGIPLDWDPAAEKVRRPPRRQGQRHDLARNAHRPGGLMSKPYACCRSTVFSGSIKLQSTMPIERNHHVHVEPRVPLRPPAIPQPLHPVRESPQK